MVSGQLVDLRLKLHKKPKYFLTFGLIFFLVAMVYGLGILGLFGIFGEPLEKPRDYILLAILCFVCGVQNGTVTSVSKSVIRTTHLTGITTDLGIGLIRIWHRHQLGAEIPNEGRANWMRAGIIFFFGLGSVLGGFIFGKFGYGGFLVPVFTSGLLFAAMVYFQAFKGSKAT
jgi:uncharacterized membrane protein YoaK (UPF0700 family)